VGTTEDREHFLSYRRQTEVKHTILEKYLPAYFNILKTHHGKLFYIDAFAGKGYYWDESSGERFPGSPIRALEALTKQAKIAARLTLYLSEKDPENFRDLDVAVRAFIGTHAGVPAPRLLHASFQQLIQHLEREIGGPLAQRLPPTFLFVDPCGISGAPLKDIARIVSVEHCEAFVFFNMDGLRRTAGLWTQGTPSSTICDLYGSREAAEVLCQRLAQTDDPDASEEFALSHYRTCLASHTGAGWILPFRIESETRAITSHYLIHVSKSALGFKIMKDIMWDLGGDEAHSGGLHLRQASTRSGQLEFDTTAAAVDATIFEELTRGEQPVTYFTEVLPCRPNDFIAPKCYKARLLALEGQGRIEVRRGGISVHAKDRKTYKGRPTLGENYTVRLKP
jgi:three-Cys-motif partner protein